MGDTRDVRTAWRVPPILELPSRRHGGLRSSRWRKTSFAVVLARKREAVAAASAFMCLVVTGLSTCGSAMPACSPQTRRHLRLQ